MHSVAAHAYRAAGSVGAFLISNVVALARWVVDGRRVNVTAEEPHSPHRTVGSPDSPATHAESMHRIKLGTWHAAASALCVNKAKDIMHNAKNLAVIFIFSLSMIFYQKMGGNKRSNSPLLGGVPSVTRRGGFLK